MIGSLSACLLHASPLFGAAELGYDELVQQAVQARNAGEFARAEELLAQARPLGRETNEVDFLLGMTQAFQERFIDALATLDRALEEYPDDLALQLGRARVLSYQSRYEAALTEAGRVLEEHPENIEALNLQARIYYYQRRYTQAIDVFENVLTLDPNNLEAFVGLYDVELARNNNDAAEQWLVRADQVAPGHIDVVTRQENQVAPIARPHLLTIGAGRSRFDQAGFTRWYDRFVEYRYLQDNGDQFYITGEHSHRFGLHDSLTEVGYRFDRRGSLPFEIAVAWDNESQFLVQRRIRLNTDFLLHGATDNFGATTLGLTATQARYSTGDVSAVGLNLTHYFLETDAWITPGVGMVRDENGVEDVSWTMGAHWQASSRWLLGYNYTHAPETENNVTALTLTHHVYGRYQLNDTTSIRIDAANSDRRNSYERSNVALSLQFRF